MVQFKVPVLEPSHGEFLNHEFARINTNGEGSVLWMIRGRVSDRLRQEGFLQAGTGCFWAEAEKGARPEGAVIRKKTFDNMKSVE